MALFGVQDGVGVGLRRNAGVPLRQGSPGIHQRSLSDLTGKAPVRGLKPQNHCRLYVGVRFLLHDLGVERRSSHAGDRSAGGDELLRLPVVLRLAPVRLDELLPLLHGLVPADVGQLDQVGVVRALAHVALGDGDAFVVLGAEADDQEEGENGEDDLLVKHDWLCCKL